MADVSKYGFRTASLLCACSSRSRTVAEPVLKRHPEATQLVAALNEIEHPIDLTALLWDELLVLEQGATRLAASAGPTERQPHRYWWRRRRLGQVRLWDRSAERIPACWRCVAALSSADVKHLCEQIGMEVIAQSLLPLSKKEVLRRLAQLGPACAEQVVGVMANCRNRPIPDKVRQSWRRELNHRCRSGRSGEAAFRIGLSVLAEQYSRLGSNSMAAFRTVCRTDICNILADHPPTEMTAHLPDGEAVSMLQRIIEGMDGRRE